MFNDHENMVIGGDLIAFHQNLEAISLRLKPWLGEDLTDEESDRRFATMCFIDEAVNSMANAIRTFSEHPEKKKRKLRNDRGQSQGP